MHDFSFILFTLSSAELIGLIIVLLHVFKKFLTKGLILIIIAMINIIAVVITGLHDNLLWYKILGAAAVIAASATIFFAIVLYGYNWLNEKYDEPPSKGQEKK